MRAPRSVLVVVFFAVPFAFLFASLCGGLVAQSPGDEAEMADRYFEAWRKEYLELDPASARRAWAEVARDPRFRRSDRNVALNRLVHLARLSGRFDELREVTRALTIDQNIDANARAQLFVYLDLVRQRRSAVFQDVPALVERYRAKTRGIGAAPEGASRRAEARAALFRELGSLVDRTRPPVAALMPDLSRIPTRSILSTTPTRTSDLSKLVTELEQLDRELRRLRRERARPGEIAKRARQRDIKTRVLKRRAARRLSEWRAEIAAYEQEGKHEAVESIVDLCLPLERLWPQRARSYSLVEALEDPVYRRGALLDLRKAVRAQLPELRAQDPQRAEAKRQWIEDVRRQMQRGAYHQAARATLAILAAAPDFVPEDARRR